MHLNLLDINFKGKVKIYKRLYCMMFRMYEQTGKHATHEIPSRVAKVVLKLGNSFTIEFGIYPDRVNDF